MAILLVVVGIWGKQLVKAIWFAMHHLSAIILQIVASVFGVAAEKKLKEYNYQDSGIYRFVAGLNFLDIFCVFFIVCFIIDPDSLPAILDETGALLGIGFLFPFVGSFVIHVQIAENLKKEPASPEDPEEEKRKIDAIAEYKQYIKRNVKILPGAVWSSRSSAENLVQRGQPVPTEIIGCTFWVDKLDYYKDHVEARLRTKLYGDSYDCWWIPVEYLRL